MAVTAVAIVRGNEALTRVTASQGSASTIAPTPSPAIQAPSRRRGRPMASSRSEQTAEGQHAPGGQQGLRCG